MKNHPTSVSQKPAVLLGLLLFLILSPLGSNAMVQQGVGEFEEYKGRVTDSSTGDPVPSAFLSVDGTNISTVTNSEGFFSLKVPDDLENVTVTVSALRFRSKTLPLSYFKTRGTEITLEASPEELSQISIFTAKDAGKLMAEVVKNRRENYLDRPTKMTAFYRESIKKRRRNVSLSEALVNIYKQPYISSSKEDIAVVRARKSVDYERLDTLAIKFRGGPFNTLYIDIMKYPELLFSEEGLNNFRFSFAEPTRINNRYLYVVDFEEVNQELPWYYGQFFVDAETLTLVKAKFHLNVDNRKVATQMFVKKKPGGTRVYPVEVNYEVDFREQDGKWFYGYGNASIEFLVNWKRKLFNSRYYINSEMAVTNWEERPKGRPDRDESFINESVVMIDDVRGFSDPSFWGETNIIEPDKSIQNAIEKIRKRIE